MSRIKQDELIGLIEGELVRLAEYDPTLKLHAVAEHLAGVLNEDGDLKVVRTSPR